ncbi:unnamed protein product [Tuber aestivum]|uniref:Uncharacterized protein n=1 Tax=Tuber aestivum TaxID=59557 RepID=A0A292PJA9_9PEZI|nr:unnamed protein product [Tuber aestivum]
MSSHQHRMGDTALPSSSREGGSGIGLRNGSNHNRTGRPTQGPAYNPLQRHPSNSSLSSENEDGDSRSEQHHSLTGTPQGNTYEQTSAPGKLLPTRPTGPAIRGSSGSEGTSDSPIKHAPKEHWMQALCTISPIVMMVGLFLLGMAFTVGHFLFYKHWQDRVVRGKLEQEYIMRAGTAFAFLSKASLAGAVVVAHKQNAWGTVRKRAITLDGIDAMFVATTDLTSFWNWDMLRRAKVASTLALLAWCIPISAIITPGSLSVNLVQRQFNTSLLIPSTNFSDTTDFITKLTLSVLQDETRKTNAPEAISSATIGPSAFLSRIASTAATGGEILPIKPPRQNCSYVHRFHGPSLRCKPADLRATQEIQRTMDYDKSGRIRYAAVYNPEISGDTCSIYVGLAYDTIDVQNETYSICGPNGAGCMSGAAQETKLDDPNYGRAFSCELFNTSFAVNISFQDSVQKFGAQKLNYLSPVSCSPLGPPTTNPHPSEEWKSSYAVFAAMGEILVGNVTKNRGTEFRDVSPVSWDTKILETTLIGSSDFASVDIPSIPNDVYTGSLARGIEELSRNITLSLLSSNKFGKLVRSKVLVRRQENRYLFNERNFWIASGIAVFVTAGAVLVGILAYYTNGVSLEANFSTVMATTQSGEMQELVRGVDVDSRELQSAVGWRSARLRTLENGHRRFVLEGGAKG